MSFYMNMFTEGEQADRYKERKAKEREEARRKENERMNRRFKGVLDYSDSSHDTYRNELDNRRRNAIKAGVYNPYDRTPDYSGFDTKEYRNIRNLDNSRSYYDTMSSINRHEKKNSKR